MTSKHRAKVGLGFTDLRLAKKPLTHRLVFSLLCRNYAYDRQCESDRAEYAVRLLHKSPNGGEIARAFSDAMETLTHDHGWAHANHMAHVAVLLYRDGYVKRKRVQRFILKHRSRTNPISLDLFLKLGRKGVTKFLKIQGKSHAKSNWSDYYPYPERNEKLLATIENSSAKINKLPAAAQAFISDVRNWKAKKRANSKMFANLNEYLRYISSNTLYGNAGKLFESLSTVDIEVIYRKLQNPDSQNELIGLLAIFGTHPYPGKPTDLLKHTNSEERAVRYRSIKAVSLLNSKKVRAAGLSRLNSKKAYVEGIQMLVSSIQDGDDRRILRKLQETTSKHVLHDAGFALIAVAKSSGPKLVRKSLKYVYLNGRCGICRAEIFSQLLSIKGLSADERRAAKFDANDRVRKIALGLNP